MTCAWLDAHKKLIQMAMLVPGWSEPVEWQLANEPQAVWRLAKRFAAGGLGGCRLLL